MYILFIITCYAIIYNVYYNITYVTSNIAYIQVKYIDI